MIHYDVGQQTIEWYELRRGKATGSMTQTILAKGKGGGESVTRRNYMIQLACERITGRVHDNYQSYDMKEGTRQEPFARNYYEGYEGVLVREAAFVDHPTIESWGISPDGLVNDDGMCQIKCPKAFTHWSFIKSGEIEKKYQLQMTAEIICAEREYSDFVSYSEVLPEELAYKKVRFIPTDEMKITVTMGVIKFLAELDQLEAEMRELIKTSS